MTTYIVRGMDRLGRMHSARHADKFDAVCHADALHFTGCYHAEVLTGAGTEFDPLACIYSTAPDSRDRGARRCAEAEGCVYGTTD